MSMPRPVLAYHNPLDHPPPGARVLLMRHADGVAFEVLPRVTPRRVIYLMGLGAGILVCGWVGVELLLDLWQPTRARVETLFGLFLLSLLLAIFISRLRMVFRPMVRSSHLVYRGGALTAYDAVWDRRTPQPWSAGKIHFFFSDYPGLLNLRLAGHLNVGLGAEGRVQLLSDIRSADLEWMVRVLNALHESQAAAGPAQSPRA